MYAFSKKLQLQQHTRRYSILAVDGGWEVREERDSEVVRKAQYHDWHRVERARRSITLELSELFDKGWSEVQ